MYPVVQHTEGHADKPVQLVLPPNTPITESMAMKVDILMPNLFVKIGEAYVPVLEIFKCAHEYSITIVPVSESDSMLMAKQTNLAGEEVVYINPGFAYAAKRDGEVSSVTYDSVIDALVYAWCNINGCTE